MNSGPFRISPRTEPWNAFTCLVFAAICAAIVALVAAFTPLGNIWWEGACTVCQGMAEPEVSRLGVPRQLTVYLVGLAFLAFLFIAALMVVLLPAVAAMVWLTGQAKPQTRGRSRSHYRH